MRFLIITMFLFIFCIGGLLAQNPWTAKTDMPTKRYVLFSSVVDGKIYAMGDLKVVLRLRLWKNTTRQQTPG